MRQLNFVVCFMFIYTSMFSQVGIGTSNPDNSSVLDVSSSTKGFLPPRLTQTEREALDALGSVNGPANGLIVYNTTSDCLEVNIGTKSTPDWTCLSSSTNGSGSNQAFGTLVGPSGQIWMDRNLGAQSVALSLYDIRAYGDYYQWGRAADGHQDYFNIIGDEPTSATLSAGNNGAADLATASNLFVGNSLSNYLTSNYSWINNSYWSTITNPWNAGTEQNPSKGALDPCPAGFRVPTETEWQAEYDAVPSGTNITEAMFDALRIPITGYRRSQASSVSAQFEVYARGVHGYYWTSTFTLSAPSGTGGVNRPEAMVARFHDPSSSSNNDVRDFQLAQGNPIRCIQE